MSTDGDAPTPGAPGTTDVPVLVVGAGPVGLAVAVQLARHGVTPLVVERNPTTKPYSKALILHVRTQQVLDALGVTDKLRALAVPLRTVEVHTYGRHVGAWHLEDPDATGPYAGPVILGQDRTEHVLAERLGELGVDVRWGTEAVALQQDADGVTARLRGPDGAESVVRAGWLVGCDGSGSRTRTTFDLPGFGDGGRYAGEQFIQADARLRWARPAGASRLFLTDVGYAMTIEMPDGLTRVFLSLPDDRPVPGADEQPLQADAPTLADVQDALRRLASPDAELSDAVWVQRYRTSHRRADRFRDGRVFIAGDAAHVHVPIGGQGMNTGLQDAVDLGWKLAAVVTGVASPALLDTYSAERQPVADALISGTDRAYRFVLRPGAAQRRLLPVVAPRLMASRRVQALVRGVLEETRIGYPDGPLAAPPADDGAGRRGRRGPRPGEWMPDPALARWPDGDTVRPSALLRTPGWPLLLLAATPDPTGLAGLGRRLAAAYPAVRPVVVLPDLPAAPVLPEVPVEIWIDRERRLASVYRARGALAALIRPDGYLAAVVPADPADRAEGALREYLRKWLTAPAATTPARVPVAEVGHH